MVRITLGSVENLVVDVTDQVGTLTALPVNTTYDVVRKKDGMKVHDNLPAARIAGLRCECTINTLNFDTGGYVLYVRFTTGNGETPRLKVGEFEVNT